MRFLEEHILKQVKVLELPGPEALLLVAVSGGSDSVALLHLMADLADKLSIRLCAVYVNHGLRPDETGAEEELVAGMALRLGLGFRTGSIPVRAYSAAHGLSVEAAARRLRYRFLEEVAEELGAVAIVVAHTADDQAEEVLLRLIRGSGRTGLAGMMAVNYRRVLRPLLQVSKAQLLDYLHSRDIPFLEDSSNAQRDFLRNRVRLDLLPYLQKNFNPAIRQTLLRTADILGTEDEFLDKLTRDLYRKAVRGGAGAESIEADTRVILAGHPALQRRVVEQIILALGGQPSFQHIDKLLAMAASSSNSGELHLAEGLRVIRRGNTLLFSYPAGRHRHRAGFAASQEEAFEKVIAGPGNWSIDELGLTLRVEVVEKVPDRGEILNNSCDCLDMSGLAFPLTVRSARPGDRFHPLGSPGSRKVANFFSDRKVARENRCRVPVLLVNDRIIALLGLRIDHSCRLVESTEKVLKVTVLSG